MAQAAARLQVVAGKAVGLSILIEDELIIGRSTEGAGRLADDDEISRLHARVSLDAGGFCAIEDLGSTNGTFVNGLRISSSHVLAEGDTIEIGQTTLVVRELPSAVTDATTELKPQRQLTPEQPPAREAQPAREPPPPTLSLQVEVDFVHCEARVSLNEGVEPAKFSFRDGSWRMFPSRPSNDEEGGFA